MITLSIPADASGNKPGVSGARRGDFSARSLCPGVLVTCPSTPPSAWSIGSGLHARSRLPPSSGVSMLAASRQPALGGGPRNPSCRWAMDDQPSGISRLSTSFIRGHLAHALGEYQCLSHMRMIAPFEHPRRLVSQLGLPGVAGFARLRVKMSVFSGGVAERILRRGQQGKVRSRR